MRRKHTWLYTYTGRLFYPWQPKVSDVNVTDIAHALSMQCRFSGHTKKFYSVAEHSIICSYLCKPEHAMYALLHDASEAYVSDLPTPIKVFLRSYNRLEKQVQKTILTAFGLYGEVPKEVKDVDKDLCFFEAKKLLNGADLSNWSVWVKRPENLSISSVAQASAYLSSTFTIFDLSASRLLSWAYNPGKISMLSKRKLIIDFIRQKVLLTIKLL